MCVLGGAAVSEVILWSVEKCYLPPKLSGPKIWSLECINITLFGKTVFTDVIKLRFLRSPEYPTLSKWVLNAITNVLVSGAEVDSTPTEEEVL